MKGKVTVLEIIEKTVDMSSHSVINLKTGINKHLNEFYHIRTTTYSGNSTTITLTLKNVETEELISSRFINTEFLPVKGSKILAFILDSTLVAYIPYKNGNVIPVLNDKVDTQLFREVGESAFMMSIPFFGLAFHIDMIKNTYFNFKNGKFFKTNLFKLLGIVAIIINLLIYYFVYSNYSFYNLIQGVIVNSILSVIIGCFLIAHRIKNLFNIRRYLDYAKSELLKNKHLS